TARLAEIIAGRRRRSGNIARARSEEIDPAAARRTAQERAGCAFVRTLGLYGAPRGTVERTDQNSFQSAFTAFASADCMLPTAPPRFCTGWTLVVACIALTGLADLSADSVADAVKCVALPSVPVSRKNATCCVMVAACCSSVLAVAAFSSTSAE